MAGLFQGDPIYGTTTTEAQQIAPEFYTNYLQDIANLGQSAVTQGGIAGFSPLQQQALQMAPDVAFSGAGSLGAASQLMGEAGATTAPDVVADYMNPYTRSVVDEMGRLQQRNIRENVLPNLGGAAIGTGQFGSRRQQQITGNVLRDLQSDLIGKQGQFLQSGYDTATKAAQTDLERALNAGRGFTALGQEQQQLGLGGLKSMFDYGAQEQALGQKMLDYPMAQAQAFSKLMQGYNIPSGEVKQTVAPGAFSNSPLSQIAGLLTAIGSFSANTNDKSALTAAQIDQLNADIALKNAQAEAASRPKAKGGVIRAPMSLTHKGRGYRIGGRVR
jgi:hypothetical protein